MHVEHFMTTNPVACEADQTVQEVAGLMRDNGVGSVVVLQNSKVVGIVTDRQLTVRALAEGRVDVPVRDVMTQNPGRLTLDDNLFSVVDTFRSAGVVRRLPVVNADNELLGVVSISDVAVVAKDLLDAVMLEETHHALQEAKIQTGGKRIVKDIRRPTKTDRLPPEHDIRPTLHATPPGQPSRGGLPGMRDQTQTTRAEPKAARGGSQTDTPHERER